MGLRVLEAKERPNARIVKARGFGRPATTSMPMSEKDRISSVVAG